MRASEFMGQFYGIAARWATRLLSAHGRIVPVFPLSSIRFWPGFYCGLATCRLIAFRNEYRAASQSIRSVLSGLREVGSSKRQRPCFPECPRGACLLTNASPHGRASCSASSALPGLDAAPLAARRLASVESRRCVRLVCEEGRAVRSELIRRALASRFVSSPPANDNTASSFIFFRCPAS